MTSTPTIATILAQEPAPVEEQHFQRRLLEQMQAVGNASTSSPSLPYGADYCGLTWSGGFVTVAVYKTGGSGGTTVKTLTFGNDGTNYTSITAS